MRLVRQQKLAFQGGAVDKVYEVDLVEVGPDRFVVNFRHGFANRDLKEGTKTTTPLARAQAENLFERVVAEKRAEGFVDPARPEERSQAAALAAAHVERVVGDREKRVLEAIRLAEKTPRTNRAIARAGELGLVEAVPLLEKLAGSSDELRDHAIIVALARLQSAASIPVIHRIGARSEMLARAAFEADRLIATEARRDFLIEESRRALPPPLATVARTGPADAFARELDAFLGPAADFAKTAVLETLYRIDDAIVRPALLAVLRNVPLAPPWFVRIRHVFKAAELRRDAEAFGILVRRFEVTPASYSDPHGWRRRDTKGVNAKRAYGRATRNYLRRRAWRTLRKLGTDASPEYVRLATGLLVAFTDADARPEKRGVEWHGSRRYGPWSAYWTFLHVLQGESAEFVASRNSLAFAWASHVKPGDPAAPGRMESFPELWDAQPAALLHLLDASRCAPVHEFAVKALRANADFTRALEADAIAMLASRPYEVTAQLGFELFQTRFSSEEPPAHLLVLLAESVVPAARREAFARIERAPVAVLAESAHVLALVASAREDVRTFARSLLHSNPLANDVARALVGRALALLQAGTLEDARALDLVKTLGDAASLALAQLDPGLARELLAAAREPLVALGAEIVLARQKAGERADGTLIARLIASPYASVRTVGVRMLGELPEDVLVASQELLVTLATHELADLRAAVRPVAKRIAERHPTFAARLAEALVQALLFRKQPAGMHRHLLEILREDLRPALAALPRERVWALVHSRVPQAQELGGLLLPTNVPSEELSVKEIVRLASHEIRSVREASWAFLEESAERVRRDLATAIGFLDARWEDSRAFGFRFFREAVPRDELTPELLVAIADSVRPDVQRFARQLIQERFEAKDGWLYLVRLAEHPSPDLQLFASTLLEGHAAGDVQKIQALAPYFVTVLSAVSRGRVAKDRALAFLRAEAQRSEDAARVAAQLLARTSVTIAIGDKAECIETLVAIKKQWPGIEVPVQTKNVPVVQPREVRGGV